MADLGTMERSGMDLQAILEAVLRDAENYRGHGNLAGYIPALGRVDPTKLGIAVALKDGRSFAVGDADEPFSIQSISYVFALSLALGRTGSALWNHVGREPSGTPLNSIVQLENAHGKPRNPFVNSGAIVVSDRLIDGRSPDLAVEELLQFLRARSGDQSIAIDEEVAMEESNAGHLNRALAHFIAAFDNLEHGVDEALSVYFRMCSVTMSCRQLARAALYLAFDGTDPLSGESVATPALSRRINSLMLTCGHYDNTGDFAFRVGLPGKSGIGGGILAVVPGVGTICAWSPGLNANGTSLAGLHALEKLVERTGWTIFV